MIGYDPLRLSLKGHQNLHLFAIKCNSFYKINNFVSIINEDLTHPSFQRVISSIPYKDRATVLYLTFS